MNNDTIYRDFESWIIDDCPINAYGMLHYGNKDDARKVAEVFAFFYQCDFNIAYDVIMKYKQLNVRKNMKQRNVIRLTESELKRVISESVKNIISELDWKTYANASKKRFNQWAQTYWRDDKDTKKKFKSYRDLLDASRDAFKRDYTYSDNDGYIDAYIDDNISPSEISSTALKPDGSDFQTSAPYFVTNQNFYGQNGRHQPGKWCVGTVGWAGAVSASPDFDTEEEAVEYAQKHNLRLTPQDKISDKLLSKWHDSNNELRNYYRGNYDYTKGKGWHLKDE